MMHQIGYSEVRDLCSSSGLNMIKPNVSLPELLPVCGSSGDVWRAGSGNGSMAGVGEIHTVHRAKVMLSPGPG